MEKMHIVQDVIIEEYVKIELIFKHIKNDFKKLDGTLLTKEDIAKELSSKKKLTLFIDAANKFDDSNRCYIVMNDYMLLFENFSRDDAFGKKHILVFGVAKRRQDFNKRLTINSVAIINIKYCNVSFYDVSVGSYINYENGSLTKADSSIINYSKPQLIKAILNGLLKTLEKRDIIVKEEKNVNLSYKFKSFLDDVEIITDKQKVQETSELLIEKPIFYSSFEATAHDSNSNIIYKFICEDFIDFDHIPSENDRITLNDTRNQAVVVTSLIDDTTLYLDLSFSEISLEDIPKDGKLFRCYNEVQTKIRKEAIKKLRTVETPLSNVILDDYSELPIIENIKDEKFNCESMEKIIDESAYRPNDAQIVALYKGALIKDSSLLVLGPPGTGKTSVIVKWTQYFVNQGKKVLITSQSHMAVNNALRDVKKDKNINCVRIGRPQQVKSPDLESILFENAQLYFQQKVENNVNESVKYIENSIKLIDEYYGKFLIEEGKLKESSVEFDSTLSHFFKKYNKKIEKYKILYNENITLKELIKSLYNKFDDICNETEKLCTRAIYRLNPFFRFKIYINKKLIKSSCFKKYKKFEKNGIKLIQLKKYLDNKIKKTNIEKLNENNKKISNSIHEIFNDKKIVEIMNEVKSKNVTIDKNEFISLKESLNKFLPGLNTYHDDLINIKNFDYAESFLNTIDVVGSTCIGINVNHNFKDIDFDVVIMDESGQILPYDAIVPLSKASEKIIMVGDHMQIPPIKLNIENELSSDTFNELDKEFEKLYSLSLFEIMYNDLSIQRRKLNYNKHYCVDLDTQFRMPDSVCKVLSKHFYDGKYKTFEGPSSFDKKPLFGLKSTFILYDTSNMENRFETRESSGYTNRLECEFICHYLINLIKENSDIEAEDYIGIITPYAAQVKLLINTVVEKGIFTRETASRIIKSLDSFQGQERNVIIYSFVRSNKNNAIGFLKESRRLNVALSRCKQQVLCVGDIDFLSNLKSEDDDVIKFTNLITDINSIATNNTDNYTEVFKYDVRGIEYEK